MRTSIKFIGLTIALVLVLFSFLFFGRQQGTYQILLLAGLLFAFIFYLVVLFGKTSFKHKIFWTIIVLLAFLTQRFTEGYFIKSSYKIYINQHQQALTQINQILSNYKGDLFILNNELKDTLNILTPLEKQKVLTEKKKLNAYLISKTKNKIYYGLWGFLDVRLGITYMPTFDSSQTPMQLFTGELYY